LFVCLALVRTERLHHQGDQTRCTRNNVSGNYGSVRRLLVTANVVPSSTIHVILMMEALRSSETSVLTRVIRRVIPEDAILHVTYLCIRSFVFNFVNFQTWFFF
jgi:hypothetical protein